MTGYEVFCETEHWNTLIYSFCRMLKTVHHNAARFNIEENKLRPFEKFLLGLEKQVLQGHLFEVGQFTWDRVYTGYKHIGYIRISDVISNTQVPVKGEVLRAGHRLLTGFLIFGIIWT